MATNILMPALSPTMTEGTLARWLKHEGEHVAAGDVLAEIETDKATMEVEAVEEGVLGKILVPDGTAGVKVNDPIAVLVEEGEAVPADPARAAGGAAAETATKLGDAAAPMPAEAAGFAAEARGATAPAPASAPLSGPAAPSHSAAIAGDGAGRIFASPLARRMAQQAGIDLSTLKGSGPNGRIIRADIEAARQAQSAAIAPAASMAQAASAAQAASVAPAPQIAAAPPAAPAAAAQRPPATIVTAPHQVLPLSPTRRVIARRLQESKQFIPHFYVTIDVELDALLRLRTELNAKSPKEGPGAFKLSVNDLLIKACAVTLRRVPRVNASFTEDAILQYDDVDISVAVAIPDGLITPIIRRADEKGLAAISNEAKELIARARAGKLKLEEFQGGGFSISNMGMYGVREFAAIINPPQAAILAVAAAAPRPVVRDGQLAIATVMGCTLSVDHRVVDGALAAEWMAAFKSIVEDPLSLML